MGFYMAVKNEELDLKKLHEGFINNIYFSAFSLMTPKENWLAIDRNETNNIEAKINEAKQKKIFNLVVIENEKVIGSINIKDLYNKNWNMFIKDVNKYSVDASTGLPKLSSIMANDAKGLVREDSPLYFVVESRNIESEPLGILTFWDLNRAPSYIFSYAVLVYLEHNLLIKIRESHQQWCNHSDVINKIWHMEKPPTYKDDIKKFINEQQKKYNYRKLSKWGLPELLAFYKFDEHIEKDSSEDMESLIGLFNEEPSFRIRIGHSVKLLVNDDEKFKDDINKLNEIWKYGRRAFIEFSDPKISHSSPIFGDL